MIDVEVAALSVAYDGAPALRGVDLRVPAAGWIGLIGPNGAGKTTVLRAITGLVPFQGRVTLGDHDVSSTRRRRLAQLVAHVPQRPEVPASMTVTDFVLLGRTPYIPYLGTESVADVAVVARVLRRLDLSALAHRPLGSLSGGEVQRAVLGRALAQEAPVLLLDEPTAALDVGNQQHVLELVDELRREHGLTVISAMHDLTLAAQFTEELVLLDGGRAMATGPARVVLTAETVRRHFGASVRIIEDEDGGILVLPRRAAHGILGEVQGAVVR